MDENLCDRAEVKQYIVCLGTVNKDWVHSLVKGRLGIIMQEISYT